MLINVQGFWAFSSSEMSEGAATLDAVVPKPCSVPQLLPPDQAI
jgi:hypothetical protein